jgi:hypothetical protein
MLVAGTLTGEAESAGGVIHSRVSGPCPRCQQCGHKLDDQQTLTAVTNLMGREWRLTTRDQGQASSGEPGPDYAQVDVTCGCGKTHRGAPPGKIGCGVSFRVELLLRQAEPGDTE